MSQGKSTITDRISRSLAIDFCQRPRCAKIIISKRTKIWQLIAENERIQLINQQIIIRRETFIEPRIEQQSAIRPCVFKVTVIETFDFIIPISGNLGCIERHWGDEANRFFTKNANCLFQRNFLKRIHRLKNRDNYDCFHKKTPCVLVKASIQCLADYFFIASASKSSPFHSFYTVRAS